MNNIFKSFASNSRSARAVRKGAVIQPLIDKAGQFSRPGLDLDPIHEPCVAAVRFYGCESGFHRSSRTENSLQT